MMARGADLGDDDQRHLGLPILTGSAVWTAEATRTPARNTAVRDMAIPLNAFLTE
jgi:hypothetical protein